MRPTLPVLIADGVEAPRKILEHAGLAVNSPRRVVD